MTAPLPALHNIAPDPMLTFETFASELARHTHFAYRAFEVVAHHPREAYNPLFIHSPRVGLTTHLIHATVSCMVEKRNATSVYCVQVGEDWTLDLLEQHDVVIFRRMRPEDFDRWDQIPKSRFSECQVVGVSDLASVAPPALRGRQQVHEWALFADLPDQKPYLARDAVGKSE
ncbi:DnaA ATPase domain-containing protein [Antrihabitans cavernicola]|uniref:Chromosomal replication initiator protein DnaA ATPAse domain-containing protein n=1 Tax=Antrihabitans cavernicola TaxID=2495913 RepID=A0A5A7SCR1_9NOCA|nr:DnaA/Hda family protein [Spelaeibacter cavernicola]KAA0022285.1 hypothetical protein FOY51_15015 [Spelaeibacter cavernicola]